MAPHRRNKSGLHPARFALLSEPEQAAVKTAMLDYNEQHPGTPFYQVEEYYHVIYRQPKTPYPVLTAALGISGALAVTAGSCLIGNLFFAAANPPLIAGYLMAGNRAQISQFCIYEVLALAGLALHLGGIV